MGGRLGCWVLVLTSPRLARPSIAVKTGASSRLFERSELRERRALREAQGTRVAGKPSGSPFFWILFFGEQRKVSRPNGRNKKVKEAPLPERAKPNVKNPSSKNQDLIRIPAQDLPGEIIKELLHTIHPRRCLRAVALTPLFHMTVKFLQQVFLFARQVDGCLDTDLAQ